MMYVCPNCGGLHSTPAPAGSPYRSCDHCGHTFKVEAERLKKVGDCSCYRAVIFRDCVTGNGDLQLRCPSCRRIIKLTHDSLEALQELTARIGATLYRQAGVRNEILYGDPADSAVIFEAVR